VERRHDGRNAAAAMSDRRPRPRSSCAALRPGYDRTRPLSHHPRCRHAAIRKNSAWALLAALTAQTSAAQNLEVKRYNPSEWTKGRFSEVVTVNGPGKTIYLAGVGAEDEKGPPGQSAPILHPGNPYEQCRYAYDKIKRLLAAHGATLADVVKQVVYVTDIRYQADVGKCRREAYGNGPIPANTFLVINGLAIQGMLLEIDVTAVVAK
jgi:enamine deaminase RidA (YjgF/YER057c/UK114 family)